MSGDNATTYLTGLSETVLSTRVTDGSGADIELDRGMSLAIELLLEVKHANRKVFLIGNGGSAAIASHVHNDVAKALQMRSVVFTEVPVLTAFANDDGYETVFESPASLWVDESDLMLVFSSSGASGNILRGARRCMDLGGRVITFTGFEADNPVRSLGEVNFYVSSMSYGIVESAHAALSHCLTDQALEAIGKDMRRGAGSTA